MWQAIVEGIKGREYGGKVAKGAVGAESPNFRVQPKMKFRKQENHHQEEPLHCEVKVALRSSKFQETTEAWSLSHLPEAMTTCPRGFEPRRQLEPKGLRTSISTEVSTEFETVSFPKSLAPIQPSKNIGKGFAQIQPNSRPSKNVAKHILTTKLNYVRLGHSQALTSKWCQGKKAN